MEQYPDWYYQKKAHKEELWYKQLPSQTAQEVCRLLDKAWKSFYALKRSGGIETPRPPRFKQESICLLYTSGKMVVIDRVSDDPYMAATGIYDVHRIANEEKLVPREWMNKDATNVTKDFVDYIKPLIQGDYQPIMVNGMPRHLVLNVKKGRKK